MSLCDNAVCPVTVFRTPDCNPSTLKCSKSIERGCSVLYFFFRAEHALDSFWSLCTHHIECNGICILSLSCQGSNQNIIWPTLSDHPFSTLPICLFRSFLSAILFSSCPELGRICKRSRSSLRYYRSNVNKKSFFSGCGVLTVGCDVVVF